MFQGSPLKKLKYEHLKHLGREMNWAWGNTYRHRSTENTKLRKCKKWKLKDGKPSPTYEESHEYKWTELVSVRLIFLSTICCLAKKDTCENKTPNG